MLSEQVVYKNLFALKVDNSIAISLEDLKAKALLIQEVCSELTDEQFTQATSRIIQSGMELYGKLPKAALFLEYAGRKPLSNEQIAAKEVENILALGGYGPLERYENPITREAIRVYGGLNKIYFHLFDKYNLDPKERTWVKKELKEIWLACADRNQTGLVCIGSSASRPALPSTGLQRIDPSKLSLFKSVEINSAFDK